MSADEHSMDMDAITAHLDRGWGLLERGDLVAARVCAHQILRLEAECPEAHTLLGAIAAAEGDLDEAEELLHQAMDLDDECVEPVLYAAEVAVLRGNIEEALELCQLGRELVDDPGAELDIRLLQLEALIAADRMEEARHAADSMPDVAQSAQASHWLRAGRAWLDLCEPARAEPLLRHAAGQPECEADARYFLGLALEHLERSAEAMEQYLRVCDLDRLQPEPGWAYSQEDFEALLRKTVEALPAELGVPLARVPFRIAAHPPPELVAEGMDPRAMIYLAGARPAPMPEESAAEAKPRGSRARRSRAEPPPPATTFSCLFVYKRPLERFARSGADIPAELRAALVEEARLALRLPADED